MMLKKTSEQSLLNEYKGHLFEYLFADALIKIQKVQNIDFIKSLNVEDWDRLKNYQNQVLLLDRILFQQLPILAQALAKFYLSKNNKLIASIRLVSRIKNLDHNADIILSFKNKSEDFLSLKLCKDQVYVNTKSAGIKSFLSKYFPHAEENQKELNKIVSQVFEKLRFYLLDFHGYDLTTSNFKEWCDEGHSQLPSRIPQVLREALLEYYHESIKAIFEQVEKIFEKHPDYSCRTFEALCGLSHNCVHLFCFHTGTQSYGLSHMLMLNIKEINNEIPKLIAPARGSSYFLIEYSKLMLQVRVKPMRDFTAPAMKINCSIKFKEL